MKSSKFCKILKAFMLFDALNLVNIIHFPKWKDYLEYDLRGPTSQSRQIQELDSPKRSLSLGNSHW